MFRLSLETSKTATLLAGKNKKFQIIYIWKMLEVIVLSIAEKITSYSYTC